MISAGRALAQDLYWFVLSSLDEATSGGRRYHLWMGSLTVVMIVGGYAYTVQLKEGLGVTGMTDHVSWGLYISNFSFLVGMAAAAVMLVLPAYVLKDVDFAKAVLVAEGVAVSALVMCLAFVVVDIGSPQLGWHMAPGVGFLNWPRSMLAWDVIVLNGYITLNSVIPFYILFSHFRGKSPKKFYVFFMYVSVFWAVSIHMVTAFLLAGLPARPFWNHPLMAPRFLASAFAAGPAYMILVLSFVKQHTDYPISDNAISQLAMVTIVAAQANLIMIGSEFFKEFYFVTHHSISAQYLVFGVHGHSGLVSWIWISLGMNVAATIMFMIHPIRRNPKTLKIACVLLFVAIWMDKGMGLIIPGFVPSPLGEVVEYSPTGIEWAVTFGIWALGLFVLSVLVKVALPIELGRTRSPMAEPETEGAHGH
jgi:molybdopterin-containing oxidoreductase family membrane subunit